MAKDILNRIFNKSFRKNDDVFESDISKGTRERGNKPSFNRKAYISKNIISLLIVTFINFIIFSLIAGAIYKLYIYIGSIITNSGLLGDYFQVYNDKNYIQSYFTVITTFIPMFIILMLTIGFSLFMFLKYFKFNKGQMIKEDHTDINHHVGDRHKLTVEEMFKQYNIFPDAGARSKTVSPSAIVGHAYIDNHHKISDVKLAVRDDEGEIVYGKDGKPVLKPLSMFDEKLQSESYESIGVIDKSDKITYDPFKIKYRKKKNGKWETVGEFIQNDWYIPQKERQRPAGVFFVETGPVNTFATAITRGNKGQTFVNHTIDIFSRENELQNLFINDPKGELFSAFHKLLEMRGFEPIVFNLMDPSKTHQFNLIGPAIAAGRIGDYDKMASLLNTIMNTFFPVQGDEPFWGEAQQALVKMIIFSMIDYYLEEEREYLQKYAGVKDQSEIGRDLDNMWGQVTMFNIYQMLTTMSRKEVLFCEKAVKNGEHLTKEEISQIKSGVESVDEKGKPILVPFVSKKGITYPPDEVEQMTELTAFFKLMDYLPRNKMRTITLQQSDAMRLMADSEKTRATVYGMALVSMLFFTDGPITAITSASPRQSLDPLSLAFPRRLRFKIDKSFMKSHKLNGRKVVFEAYRDERFKDLIVGQNKGDFEHETRIDKLGWVEFRFKGIFEEYKYIEEADGSITKVPKPIFIKMKIIDDNTKYSIYTYLFEFTRGYAKTVDGRRFVRNPQTGQRIEQGGTLRVGEINKETGKFERVQKLYKLSNGLEVLPIEQTDAVYNIRPKAIFSITPPHLTDYIKVVIVMVSVLFDTSVGESYVTKDSGKPFYKTRNILDEIGNMQFNGIGIPDFQTKLSIGLGQGQEYTMILQTLQQLRDVYGESVDKIAQSNTAIFMYLISNDTQMLEEISKQAGTTHTVRAQNKNLKEDRGIINKIDNEVTTQYGVEEEPLFSINELLSFTSGESMVLSARHDKDNSGEKVRPNPIHNTKSTMIPMSYKLHQDGHNSPLFKTSLQNAEVATSSNDRDVYQDIPSFTKMYQKRLAQATRSINMTEKYMEIHNLTEDDLNRKDIEDVSESVMRMINISLVNSDEQRNSDKQIMTDEEKEVLADETKYENDFDPTDISNEVKDEDKQFQGDIKSSSKEAQAKYDNERSKQFIDHTLSINDFKQRSIIQNILGQALYKTKITRNTINSDLYSFESKDGVKQIIENTSGIVVAEMNRQMVTENQEASWFVKDEFMQLLLNKINSNEVDKYFDIDSNGMVKNHFKILFREETKSEVV